MVYYLAPPIIEYFLSNEYTNIWQFNFYCQLRNVDNPHESRKLIDSLDMTGKQYFLQIDNHQLDILSFQ